MSSPPQLNKLKAEMDKKPNGKGTNAVSRKDIDCMPTYRSTTSIQILLFINEIERLVRDRSISRENIRAFLSSNLSQIKRYREKILSLPRYIFHWYPVPPHERDEEDVLPARTFA
jgi:hypothetical protein